MRTLVLTLVLGTLLGGCSFARRSDQTYLRDTRKLLQTKDGDIRACFDGVLKANEKASGTVTVQFKVAADTGKVTEPQIVADKTTAPDNLADCVVGALQGLTLKPGDVREGDATFTWAFVSK